MADEVNIDLLQDAKQKLGHETLDTSGMLMLADSLFVATETTARCVPCLVLLGQVAKRLYAAGEVVKASAVRERVKTVSLAHAKTLVQVEQFDPADCKGLAKVLKGFDEHALARRLLEKVRASYPHDIKAAQQLSLCTYKDEELPPDSRLHDALAILEAEPLHLRDVTCIDPETLGQGGAISKRRWERSGQIEDLYTALHFYQTGWTKNQRKDMGYCGVNAAYILDLLAHQACIVAAREKVIIRHADEFVGQARQLRETMKQRLPVLAAEKAQEAQEEGNPEDDPTKQWWYLVTMAEVAFGLKEWSEVESWLQRARNVGHDEWELQTAVKQLVAIARLQGVLPPKEKSNPDTWAPTWKALSALLGEATEQALTCHRGKVGLALSGGGFRASLFHLGVLARLAEVDALRSVEALSTVSGGSIVGAHYYLALRNLLMSKRDNELTREDYIALVREMKRQFLKGVQKNLRTRVLANLSANLRMLFSSYGRSNRMGELYEKHLYRPITGKHNRMQDLLIHPKSNEGGAGQKDTTDKTFKPKFSNWRRRAKVPILLLNATSLNSGHSWHFTASWMGEPPGLLGSEVDLNARYRRLYYHQAPNQKLQDYPLGYAVAASACVPGLFDPLVLDGLYPGRTVRLVDGGVHDNQGVAGLLDEGCTLILCSDASGQMEDQSVPPDGVLSVPLRSNSILMDRVREAQYQDLRSRAEGHALAGLFFIHLKQGLSVSPIDWVNCDDPSPEAMQFTATEYGIDRDIQARLAAIRTDLDSFTEVEAYALMLSGYLMTEHELKCLDKEHKKAGGTDEWGGFQISAPRGEWKFLELEQIMRKPRNSTDLRRRDLDKQLAAGAALVGKVWKLVPALKATLIIGALAGLSLAICFIVSNWHEKLDLPSFSVGGVAITVLLLVIGSAFPMMKWLDPQSAARSWVFKAGLAIFGFFASNIHVKVFDPFYLWRGKLDRLFKLPEGER